jgi:hypothetical protein
MNRAGLEKTSKISQKRRASGIERVNIEGLKYGSGKLKKSNKLQNINWNARMTPEGWKE